jgi:hypothetical protein
MGRQESLIQLRGGVGNLSFYKTQDGYLARKRSGVTGDRFRSDPRFRRTRENAAEFTRAGKATQLLRTAFRKSLKAVADNRVTSRLVAAMMKVIQADAVSARGHRNVIDGEIALLQGFEFNEHGPLATTFLAPYTATIDRQTGTMVVDIPAFSAEEMISIPEGATHIRLKAGGAAIDFEANTHSVSSSESEPLPITLAAQGPLQLTQAVAPASVNPLILAFGIEFLQLVNDIQYPLKNGAHNAMAIVKVDGGVIA